MTKHPRFLHFVKRPEWWSDKRYVHRDNRPPFAIHLNTGGPEPSQSDIDRVVGILERLPLLKFDAAELIGEQSYSYEHYYALGTPIKRLVKNPTPEALAESMTIREITITELDKKKFEISFDVTWNDYHTYEVWYDSNGPVSCAGNDNGLTEPNIRKSTLCSASKSFLATTASSDFDVVKQVILNELEWNGFGRGKRLSGKLIHLHGTQGSQIDIEYVRDYPILQLKPLIALISRVFSFSTGRTAKVIDELITAGVVSVSFRNQIIQSVSS